MTIYKDYIKGAFTNDVALHQLTILHDNGLYRHLRCARPGTCIKFFDVVTWPKHLHIGGDTEGFTFACVDDMFNFFRPMDGWNLSQISPQYWAEKITDGRERAREYSRALLEREIWRAVRDEYQTAGKGAMGLAMAVSNELIDNLDFLDFEETARMALAEFKFAAPTGNIDFSDLGERHIRDWAYSYLWACHAIQWAIGKYDMAKSHSAPIDLH